MTTDDEQTGDQPANWPPVGELPGQLPFDRLDYGDAEQLAEMTGVDEPAAEEPLQLVDEPLRIPQPYGRAQKRRNQRPLPT
ncbi:hypothetical protein DLE60_04370 [Micromonospora globispora]|uniref:Uncharacterized protein n=1 Tax=Micromonospora globispora TaxID=1450148 RepID=A0A317JXK6_9ACTN|nr:hypothetical protein [Micromonospora globispora]PWU45060.1 hypothetical protein DLJ46_22735 [Micromonospora globispora]PWU61682.1 hypothetical protein DLE60_04370 [Micromonospora globispora]RQW98051.1 hypothetical protein DKL51_11110 [Micromonospora globispora]